MTSPLHALSIKQPWAWAIVHARKQVENRGWAPPRALCGQRIAIHASKGLDADGFAPLSEIIGGGVPSATLLPKGQIVATARLVGAARVLPLDDPDGPRVAVGQLQGHLDEHHAALIASSPYSSGPWCWVLEDVVDVTSARLFAKGALGLWRVPPGLAEEVRAAEAAAGRPAAPHVVLRGHALAEHRQAVFWRLPTGRELWIPASQVLAESADSITITSWLAQRENLTPTQEPTR